MSPRSVDGVLGRTHVAKPLERRHRAEGRNDSQRQDEEPEHEPPPSSAARAHVLGGDLEAGDDQRAGDSGTECKTPHRRHVAATDEHGHDREDGLHDEQHTHGPRPRPTASAEAVHEVIVSGARERNAVPETRRGHEGEVEHRNGDDEQRNDQAAGRHGVGFERDTGGCQDEPGEACAGAPGHDGRRPDVVDEDPEAATRERDAHRGGDVVVVCRRRSEQPGTCECSDARRETFGILETSERAGDHHDPQHGQDAVERVRVQLVHSDAGDGDRGRGRREHREVRYSGKVTPVVDHPEQHDGRRGGGGDTEPYGQARRGEPSCERCDREHGPAEETQPPLADVRIPLSALGPSELAERRAPDERQPRGNRERDDTTRRHVPGPSRLRGCADGGPEQLGVEVVGAPAALGGCHRGQRVAGSSRRESAGACLRRDSAILGVRLPNGLGRGSGGGRSCFPSHSGKIRHRWNFAAICRLRGGERCSSSPSWLRPSSPAGS